MVDTSNYIEAYYVDPENGDDNNPGTIDLPFQTIQQGIDVAGENENDGNQVFLQGGTYNLTEPLEIDSYSGRADSFLTIQSVAGETAILNGSQVEQDHPLIHVKEVQYVNITGLEIRDAPSHGIEVVNGSNINIFDNLIYNTQGMGIRVRGHTGNSENESDTTIQSTDIVIENNEVYQTNLSNSGANKGVDNWGAGIQAWNVDNVVITNNLVGENYGEGIGLTLADNSVATNNTVFDNFSVQIYLDNVTDSVVDTNFVYNTGNTEFYRQGFPAHGIGFANEIHNVAKPNSFSLDDNLIQHNVIVGANSGIIYGTWAGRHQSEAYSNFLGLRNTTISQNTVYNSQSYSINLDTDPNNANIDISNNVFSQESDNSLAAVDSLTGANFAENLWFGGEPGDAYSSTDILADPLFVNPGGNSIDDYQLQPDSLGVELLQSDDVDFYSIANSPNDFSSLEFGDRFSR